MKKLSIEEKAKAHDKAIEALGSLFAEQAIKHCDRVNIKDITNIFPELKESEDESIRKWIIGVLSTYEHDRDLRNAALAWLEKQGTSYTKKDVDDAYLEGVTNTKYEIEKQYEATYQIRKDIATFIFNYRGNIKDRAKWMDYLGIKVYFIEKQGEQQDINPSEYINDMGGNGCYLKNATQKPIGVEPKFKVGDWISGYYTNYKVLSVNNNGYVAEDVDGNKINIFFENEMFHSFWNIRDAQNGDVLAVNNEVFIYAHKKQLYSIAVAHCFVDSIGVFHFDGEFGYMESGNSIHPATKEQRDLLFQKMKEAGYEWDAEKKELKKIEQKSSWSEEDDEHLERILKELENQRQRPLNSPYLDKIESDYNWLKSLKERYTWKPSEEQMDALGSAIVDSISSIQKHSLESLYNELKKLF